MVIATLIELARHDRADLESKARKVVSPAPLREPGLSDTRHLSYLGGRAAIGYLLQNERLEASVRPNPRFGYLELAPPCQRFANVSHTDRWAAAVLGHRTVGIDIERLDRDSTMVVRRVIAESEKKFLGKAHAVGKHAVSPALALWCAKESVSKALGLGIVFGMQDFEIDLAVFPHAVKLSRPGPLPLVEPVVHLELKGELLVAVCSERSELQNGVKWLDMVTS